MDDDRISPVKRVALIAIDSLRNMVVNDCDDETIANTLPKVSIPIKVGIVETDFMSYDDAIKELNMGYNRNKLSKLAKQYGIKSHKFRNMPIGFHKDDIARLKEELNKKRGDE